MAALDSIMVMLNAMFTTYLLSPNKVCCYVNHAFWPLPGFHRPTIFFQGNLVYGLFVCSSITLMLQFYNTI